jgi:putative transposase
LINNWTKTKQKITKLNKKMANIRLDKLHKLSTNLSKSLAIIVLENQQIKNMTKSAKGDAEQHGKMVNKKSGLNRVILNQGWGIFKELLTYKQAWQGGRVIFVDPKFTSQTCPECLHKSKDNRQTQSHFECIGCGYTNHADHVGSLNILARGHRVIACGETAVTQLHEAGTCDTSDSLMPNLVFY